VTKDDLIAFESEVAKAFESKLIPGPIHLSGGNEDQLIDIFKDIKPTDWVFSTWRSHYHALLHGIPPEKVMNEIMSGRSMSLMFPEHNFFTSAIVGGIIPIAVGLAYALKGTDTKVWCFIGDMAETTGVCHECEQFAIYNDLPIVFIVEDNGLSCNSPTSEAWGSNYSLAKWERYTYKRSVPHCGTGKWVTF
jgi:pyruvate dehydrogenase E1 component alpha subunit